MSTLQVSVKGLKPEMANFPAVESVLSSRELSSPLVQTLSLLSDIKMRTRNMYKDLLYLSVYLG